MALFALFAIGLYVKGKAIGTWTMRRIKDDGDETEPHYGRVLGKDTGGCSRMPVKLTGSA